jgi:hypothetical protein
LQAHEGGWNPQARVKEVAIDGVSAEVLHPSLTMDLYAWMMPSCRKRTSGLTTTGSLSTGPSHRTDSLAWARVSFQSTTPSPRWSAATKPAYVARCCGTT